MSKLYGEYTKLTSFGVPTLKPVHSANGIRYFAHRTEEGGGDSRKLVITAMSDGDDFCPKILGTLVSPMFESKTTIEWIEVIAERRREGIGREMWKLAERLLGHELEHNPVTRLGTRFADAMEAKTELQ